jgi:hypothetical protein
MSEQTATIPVHNVAYHAQQEKWHARDVMEPVELELNKLRKDNALLEAQLRQREEDNAYEQLNGERMRVERDQARDQLAAMTVEYQHVLAEIAALKAQQAEDNDNAERIEAEMMARANRRAV